MTELIPYANAHVNQHTTNGVKGLYQIEENKTNKNLGSLPAYLSEAEVFSILDILRKAELDAFNIGIEFGKEKGKEVHAQLLVQLESNLQRCSNENERLSEVLDNMTKVSTN